MPRRPASRVYVIGLVALVLIGGLLWGTGGLERRHDRLPVLAPGTTVLSGPYAFVFTSATAQRTDNSFTHTSSWKVAVIGTGRTTGSVSLSPDVSLDGPFVSKDDRTGEIQAPDGDRLGDPETYDQRDFTPGLAPVRYEVHFTYSAGFTPGPTLHFAVSGLELRDESLLKDQEPSWVVTNQGHAMYLPLKVLPPTD